MVINGKYIIRNYAPKLKVTNGLFDILNKRALFISTLDPIQSITSKNCFMIHGNQHIHSIINKDYINSKDGFNPHLHAS